MLRFIRFLLLLGLPTLCSSFQPSKGPTATRPATTQVSALYDPSKTSDEFVDFPTPLQKTTLKKEAAKREARKELKSFAMPPEETLGPFSGETIQALWTALAENELVQVRGVAKDNKKLVFGTAERLCAELEIFQEDLPVSLLSTKGHTVLLFSPALPIDHELHVKLRTSVGQKNTWRVRPKPLRDNRGQIIKHDVE